MKEIGIEEMRQVQLAILDTVHDFCVDNDINYFLTAGTLLGAVRHKGYIPWDDDIDLGMIRDDYDRFMELFNRSNDRYKFFSVENKSEFPYAYGKVMDTKTVLYEPDENGRKLSVYVDVFAYDNAPDDDNDLAKMFRRRNIFRALNTSRTQKNYNGKGKVRLFIFRILHVITKPFPLAYFAKKMADNSKRYTKYSTRRVGDFMSYYNMSCDKKALSAFVDLEFEGKKYKAPIGYDEWLRSFYGEYMQLPPEEERVSTHAYKAYFVE